MNELPQCPTHLISYDPSTGCPECMKEQHDYGVQNPLPGTIIVHTTDQPPKGLTPRHEWDAQRKKNILNAMKRYSEAKWPVPKEWINELEDLQ